MSSIKSYVEKQSPPRPESYITALAACLTTLLMSGAAVGQSAYGEMYGSFTDASGVPVAGARVTVTSQGRGGDLTTATNEFGKFQVTGLLPDIYTIKVEEDGFKTFRETEIPVVAELLTAFELQSCADRATETYSGGQRRRLDIALGLVHRPEVLFLDEPTTGLDPQSRARMWDEVRHLREGGTTVFLTTHYLEEADALCDQLAIIDHGRIVAEGTPDELKRAVAGDVITLGVQDPQIALQLLYDRSLVRDHDPLSPDSESLRVYVDDGEAALLAIIRVLDERGVPLQSISLSRPSLDDVFLRQTGRKLREEAA